MVKHLLLALLCVSFLPLKMVRAEQSIKVYAAASMTNVISELADDYFQQTGIRIVTVYAGSSSLARQIESGAPADLFISANTKWVDYLVEKKLIDGNAVEIIAENELVLISPVTRIIEEFDLSNEKAWDQLLNNERLAIGQPDYVPAGIYAKQSLVGIGVWDTVKSQTAPTNSVRSALALVEMGEAALGIVYKTDAFRNDKVTIVAGFANQWHEPILYPLAILSEDASVNKFAQYLLSDEAKQVFIRYGFK